MNLLSISKNRVRDYLSEKLAHNIVNSEIEDLVLVLRYNALGGFEFLSDDDLFENLAVSIPELSFAEIESSDDTILNIRVKKEHFDEENDIFFDIKRALQII